LWSQYGHILLTTQKYGGLWWAEILLEKRFLPKFKEKLTARIKKLDIGR